MKRYFLFIAAVIATLFIASCSKVENPSAPGAEAEVTFSLQTPEIQTRAIGDGNTVNKLVAAVYKEDGTYLFDQTVDVNNGSATVTLKLVNGVDYKLVFWAYNENAPYDFDTDHAKLTVNYNNNTGVTANDENLDAFYLMKEYTPAGMADVSVTLKRPFAQLNMVTGDFNAAAAVGVNVSTTSIAVDVYNTMNMLDGSVSGKTPVTFAANVIPDEELDGYTEYKWLAMNYLLVNNKELVDVTMCINGNTTGRTFSYIPVQRNYRTIIYGDLLSSNITFDVDIDSDFDDAHIVVYGDVTYAVADDETKANELFALGSKAVYIESITATNASIKLPETNEDVYLILPGTDKSVTVEYAEGATDEQKPENIFISIPDGTVKTLTVNTLASTVDVTGSVTTLTASTASNTLYLTNAIVGNLTVTQGNVYVDEGSQINEIDDNSTSFTLYVEEGAVVPDEDELPSNVTKVSNKVTSFAQLQAAIDNGCPIIYIKNDIDDAKGISINTGKSLTIDFGGYTYTVGKPGAGSAGTTTLAFQLRKGQDITFRNGTIACHPDNINAEWETDATEKGIARIIQNYCNLTLENMTIDGANIAHNTNNEVRTIVSNNSGNVEFRGNTSIKAIENDYAFDVCKYLDYEAPVVTWNSNGEVEGFIELSGGEFIVNSNLVLNAPIKATAEAKLTVNATISEADDYPRDPYSQLIVVKRRGNLTINGSGNLVNNGGSGVVRMIDTEGGESTEGEVAKLTVNGGNFTSQHYPIFGNGLYHGTEIIINNGTFKSTDPNGGLAIYHPQNGTLTINGGTLIGRDSAIELRAGTLNINGGNFSHTYNGNMVVRAQGSGNSVDGATIVISQHNTHKPVVANITGGTFTSPSNGKAFYEDYTFEDNGFVATNCLLSISGGTFNGPIYSENFIKFITGGTFTLDPTNYVQDGYQATENESNYWVVSAQQ